MPEIPENAKKPADRKPKKKDAPEAFTFEHDGEQYTFKPTYDVLTPGWLRKNRRRDETDAFFTMVEALVQDDETLDVIDNMTRSEFRALMTEFYEYLEVADSGE